MKTDLHNKICLITGGAGFLGRYHAEAIIECGGFVILSDINENLLTQSVDFLNTKYALTNGRTVCKGIVMDVTDPTSIQQALVKQSKIDILINNAALDPKVNNAKQDLNCRFEKMPLEFWQKGLDVIVNGTFLTSQAVVNKMTETNTEGVILNIASDLSIISPDQRIYRKKSLKEEEQVVKPITYSAAKHAIVGMTKYLSVYLAPKKIRVNALSPGAVFKDDMPQDFVEKICNLIPMNRMANPDEYKGAVAFLCSDSSSYMTGQNISVSGGRDVW